MPTPIRSIVLALAAALLLGACLTDAKPQQADPAPPQALACSGPSDAACGPGAFCRVTAPGAEGVCTKRPEICPMIYQPVCGADGKTYPNTCHAERVAVNVAHPGACGK